MPGLVVVDSRFHDHRRDVVKSPGAKRDPVWLSPFMRVLRLPFVSLAVLVLGACGPGLVASPDGGGGEGEGEGEGEREPIDVGAPPTGFGTAPVGPSTGACSTDQWWIRGDRESDFMHPGDDCTACHVARREGPILRVAGTVFQNLDDETDCRGIPDAVIEIIGSDGTVAFSMTANAAGNFFSTQSLTGIAPYTARVTYDGRTIEMRTPQTEGACNSCHTAVGVDGAPGRIVVP